MMVLGKPTTKPWRKWGYAETKDFCANLLKDYFCLTAIYLFVYSFIHSFIHSFNCFIYFIMKLYKVKKGKSLDKYMKSNYAFFFVCSKKMC